MSKKSEIARKLDRILDEFKHTNNLTKFDMMELCSTYLLNKFSNQKSNLTRKVADYVNPAKLRRRDDANRGK